MICKKCGLDKSLHEFHRDSRTKTGYYSVCKQCRSERRLEIKAVNPEKIRAKKRAYYAANREKEQEASRRWRAKNPEKAAKVSEKWRKKNPERYRSTSLAWYHANPEKTKASSRKYRLTHLENLRINSSRHKARKKHFPDTFTESERSFMLQYWHYACAVCGNENGFQWTLADDHWIPLASHDCPGTVATNMIPLCHGLGGCNNSKANKDPSLWLLSRYSKQQTKKILEAIMVYFQIVERHIRHETD